jgi:predicted RND superfamily exporter protein
MPWATPLNAGTEIKELIYKFIEGRGSACGKSLKAHADRRFASYDLGLELIAGLFSGCAIAAPVSFLVLILSTTNIILALYATVSIAFIVLSVLGFCKEPMGWGLGIGESIAGVIVIGYSVDYVVHLAHMYNESRQRGFSTRGERACFSVQNMGSTVFAGAITTAGSGAIMFMCFFYFFTKMAVLICATIVYSFLYALLFFVPLCFLAGPEGTIGDLNFLKFSEKKSKTDVSDSSAP